MCPSVSTDADGPHANYSNESAKIRSADDGDVVRMVANDGAPEYGNDELVSSIINTNPCSHPADRPMPFVSERLVSAGARIQPLPCSQ